jgi:nucleotide-binding universal stress UspA family protein
VFSKIVVATDGSNTAKLAVSVAADLAKGHDAVLHIVNAYRASSGGVGVVLAGPVGVAGQETSTELLKAASRELLAEAVSALGDLRVETHSKRGTPANVIIGVAENVGADLIVVGSKGMRGARRMIGSVPNSVAHRAPCHVLIAKTT